MKYLSKFIDKNFYKVFKVDDNRKCYRYDNGEWTPLDREIDYWSGFGDSYLFDVISEEEAKKILGVSEL